MNVKGRLRPDFLARCSWDDVLGKCTGQVLPNEPNYFNLFIPVCSPPQLILSGRKSFPSGHSSMAFSGMTILTLWLAGKTAAWTFNTPRPAGSLKSSRMASFLLTLLPIFGSSFVAITRLQDYVRTRSFCNMTRTLSELATPQGGCPHRCSHWHRLRNSRLSDLLAQSFGGQ